MNILIVSYVYPSKRDMRLGLFVQEQAKELVRQAHNVFILAPDNSKDGTELIDGIIIYRLGLPRFLRGMFFNFKVLSKIMNLKGKIDIIHLHFIGLNSIFCWLGSRIAKVPFVATSHGMDVCTKNFFHSIILRFYLLFPQKIMAVSKFTSDLAAINTDGEKIVIINNGVDMDKLKLKEKPSSFKKRLGLHNKKILLSVGGLVERKGHKIIIEALADVVKEVPNLVYLIIGRGNEENNLKAFAKSLNVQNYIRFLGYVNDEEIANYFDACDVFVLMSKTIKRECGVEGFGIAYIEASAIGKPVIGGKSGGTGDAIINNVTGFRIEPDDKDGLIKKLVLLLKDTKLRKKLGAAGRKMVLKKFLWKHNVDKTLQIYNKVLGR